jgi:hypothetical protein
LKRIATLVFCITSALAVYSMWLQAAPRDMQCRVTHWDLQGEIVRCDDDAAICYFATHNGALSCIRR